MVALIPAVAEPPELQGPPASVIVTLTSDSHAGTPNNSKVCRVSLGNPNHPRILLPSRIHYRGIAVLQQFIQILNIRVKVRKTYIT